MQYLRGGCDQRQARFFHTLIIHQNALCIVVAVVAGGQVAQLEGDVVRRLTVGRGSEHLGIFGQLQHQGLGLRTVER